MRKTPRERGAPGVSDLSNARYDEHGGAYFAENLDDFETCATPRG